MLCKVITPFPFAKDGINPRNLCKDEVIDFPEGLVSALKAEGLIGPNDDDGNQDALEGTGGKVLETKVVEPDEFKADKGSVNIPDGWTDLPWPELRGLACRISDDPIKSRVDAIAAIQAEIDSRA